MITMIYCWKSHLNCGHLFQIGSFEGQKLHVVDGFEKVSHVLEILNCGLSGSLRGLNGEVVDHSIVDNLDDSAGVDSVEDVAENETVAECEAEFLFGGFFGE